MKEGNENILATVSESPESIHLNRESPSPVSSSGPPVVVMPSSSKDADCSMSKKDELKLENSDEHVKKKIPPQPPIKMSISSKCVRRMKDASYSFNNNLKCLRLNEEKLTSGKENKKNASKVTGNAAEKSDANIDGSDKENEHDFTTTEISKTCKDNEKEQNKGSKNTVSVKKEDDVLSSNEDIQDRGRNNPEEPQINENERKNTPDRICSNLFIEAASMSNNAFLKEFLTYVKLSKNKDVELELCLLLFLDMDKSTKLVTAFDMVATCAEGRQSLENTDETEQRKERNKRKANMLETEGSSCIESLSSPEKKSKCRRIGKDSPGEKEYRSKKKEGTDIENPNMTDESFLSVQSQKKLGLSDLVSLFDCFILSLYACMQDISKKKSDISPDKKKEKGVSSPENKYGSGSREKSSRVSPDICGSKDANKKDKAAAVDEIKTKMISPLSTRKKEEIRQYAIYAAEKLLEFTMEQPAEVSPKVRKDHLSIDNTLASFEDFGSWYNKGGFDIMPWLELLDLGKWKPIRAPSPPNTSSMRETGSQVVKQKIENDEEKYHDSGVVVKQSDPLSRAPTPNMTKDSNGEKKAPSSSTPSKPSHCDDNNAKQDKIEKTSTNNEKKQQRPSGTSRSKGVGRNRQNVVPPTQHFSPSVSHPDSNMFHPQEANIPQSHSTSRAPEENDPLCWPESSSHSSLTATPDRSIVSFDFTSSMPSYHGPSFKKDFCINITEENLSMLKRLVTRTGLSSKSPTEVCDILLKHSYRDQLSREDFVECVRKLVPSAMTNSGEFRNSELKTFSNYFINFFSCFDRDGKSVANAKELAVGFSFLCAGNKSKKLASSFEVLDLNREGFLSADGLTQYLRSYLTMLVGISFLSSKPLGRSEEERALLDRKRANMYIAVDNGAQRTQAHVFKNLNSIRNANQMRHRDNLNNVSFEEFAEWYTDGGYSVAPWLELLDLTKFLSLLETTRRVENNDRDTNDHKASSVDAPNVPISSIGPLNSHDVFSPTNYKNMSTVDSSLRSPDISFPSQDQQNRHHSKSQFYQQTQYSDDFSPFMEHPSSISNSNPSLPPHMQDPITNKNSSSPYYRTYLQETLFNFPLAHGKSLVVTREDAQYVHRIVDQLHLLSFEPEEVWSSLHYTASLSSSSGRYGNTMGKNPLLVDQGTFTHAIETLIGSSGRRINQDSISTIQKFFQSFDLRREGRLPLNQLMGGLTLLCGGRKSAKLSFAFMLFDDESGRQYNHHNHPGMGMMKNSNSTEIALTRQNLLTFFQSFLIVLFSCCAQSLELHPEKVTRYICDTAEMVCEDVLKHQWRLRRTNRVNFDDFGEWYNEGGFETAPWLELLDLNKWVLLDPGSKTNSSRTPGHNDHYQMMSSSSSSRHTDQHHRPTNSQSGYKPSSGPDFATRGIEDCDDHYMDGSNTNNRSTVEEDMDFMMSQVFDGNENESSRTNVHKPSTSKYHDHNYAHHDHYQQKKRHYNGTGSNRHSSSPDDYNQSNSLKFNVLTNDDFRGYIVSLTQHRVNQLRSLVTDSGLYRLGTSKVCDHVLKNVIEPINNSGGNGKLNERNNEGFGNIRKEDVENIARSILSYCASCGAKDKNAIETRRNMLDTCMLLFQAFDSERKLVVNSIEFLCGLSILCGGRKSDKLEYAFDLLDYDKDGKLSRRGMFMYLRSFLTVVMGFSYASLDRSFCHGENLRTITGDFDHRNTSFAQAIDAGAAWATDEVFRPVDRSNKSDLRKDVSFDDFADWYTRGGYSSIPWIELLDLKKWVLVES